MWKKKREDDLERCVTGDPRAAAYALKAPAVVLIIDKSSSMEGKKMELARLAAIGVVENLRPIDQVGVLIFDNSFQWSVPLRRAEDRASIKRLISGITSGWRNPNRAGAHRGLILRRDPAVHARVFKPYCAAHRRYLRKRATV